MEVAKDDNKDEETDEPPVIKPRPNQYGGKEPRGKPEAMAIALARDLAEKNQDLPEPTESTAVEPTKPKAKRTTSPKRSRKKAPPATPDDRSENLLSEDVPPITEAEYENLEALMIQFCRVPLLAEFSRPVALLHPEVRKSTWRGVYCDIVIIDPLNLCVLSEPSFFLVFRIFSSSRSIPRL